MRAEGDPTRGPDYRLYVNLMRYAKKTVGRQRYYKQQQILRESGITCAKGGYHKEYPIPGFNLYKGPDSHPNNPWFPAMSPGYKQYGKDAVRAWAPAQLAATSAPGSHSSTFAGGSSKRFWRSSRGAGSAMVLHAHKKTSASTKNQGHSLLPHFWGLTKHAHQGAAVKAGTRLAKQKGMNWYPGKNVARGKDYSLVALRDGIVQWRGEYRHREISIVPWEYVREKCTWINPNTLGPKQYEPWMGTRNHGKRHYILNLREEWLRTDEGKEWQKKKDEKTEKQKEITKKFRAFRKSVALKKGKIPLSRDGPVSVGVESGSEAEA